MTATRYTIRYTRREVDPATETPTGRLLHFDTTITADTQVEAQRQFLEDYEGFTDVQVTSITPHHPTPAGVHVIPTEAARAYYGPQTRGAFLLTMAEAAGMYATDPKEF